MVLNSNVVICLPRELQRDFSRDRDLQAQHAAWVDKIEYIPAFIEN